MRLILSLFCLFVLFKAHSQKELTNQLIWASGEFSSQFVDGLNSMNDGLHYTGIENSDAFGSKIVRYSYETGKEVSVIATSKDIFGDAGKSIEGYEFSSDETKLLIQTETEAIYRHSFAANYYIHDLKTSKTYALADFAKGKQMLAEFSPNGNHVAFVRNNNLFLFETETKKESAITQDGEINKIINGATDWVYEEEFAISKGFEWSPLGNRIAFYRFDESAVKEFSMDMFGELYPTQYKFKYPKAGEKNSEVGIFIYDMPTGRTIQVNTGNEKDQYIPRIKWTKNNDALCVMRMNRHQSKLEFLRTDMSKTQPFALDTEVIYTEQASTYIDINESLNFLVDGSFIWMSEKNGYNHLYHFDAKGKQIAALTSGPFDIIDFYGFDEKSATAYFSSTATDTKAFTEYLPADASISAETNTNIQYKKKDSDKNTWINSTEKHIFSVTKKGKKTTIKKLSVAPGYNDSNFSTGYKYYIIDHSDANTPPSTTLYSNTTGKPIRTLVDNKALKERISNYNLTTKEFFEFTNSTGTTLNCWMMKPKNFDAGKKYPVLVAIYGGPGSNTVTNAWGGRNYMWHQLMCQQGYIVVSCDPRGTQFRGREFKHSTYMNLGKNETDDFIDLAKYLGNQSYIDSKRIGIQGWSYGGYMTSLCMTKGADFYTAGVAVAPVTNWKYYDTIYTERFLRTPQENSGGYENNSPINFVDALKGKFLLVHGSADDNVHYQNSMDMISALVKANKQFDLFIYPNKNHGIYGGNTRLHLFTMITDYFKSNL